MSQRILFTVEHLYPFGEARMLLPLASELKRRGDDVVVVVLGQHLFEPKVWLDRGIRVFFANGDDLTPLHTSRDAFYVVKELRQILRLVEPDRVHCWSGEAIWLTLLATQNPPLIKPLPRFRLTATQLTLLPRHHFLREWTEGRLSQTIETMVVPHDCIAEQVRDLEWQPQSIRQIANCFVRESFEPQYDLAFADRGSRTRAVLRSEIRAGLRVPDSHYLAVAVADLEPKTRLKDLVWATDLLACVRDDFHLAIIGVGKQRWRLKRFAAQTEASPVIHFLDLVDCPEQLLASADVYWQSHLQNPQDVTMLTAMAMGVPTISVLGDGTNEVIKHQETGFATNFGARDEFARWTKYLIEQDRSGAQLARQGQAFVEEEFPFAKMFQAYEEVFDR